MSVSKSLVSPRVAFQVANRRSLAKNDSSFLPAPRCRATLFQKVPLHVSRGTSNAALQFQKLSRHCLRARSNKSIVEM